MINTAGYKICDIEKENGPLALEIAAEGIVLLENSGALPFMIYMKGRSSISSALSCGIPAPQ